MFNQPQGIHRSRAASLAPSTILGAAVALLCIACRPSIPESNYPTQAATEDPVTEAKDTWREVSSEADQPLPSLDSCDRDHLRIRTQVPEQRFRDLCHRCGVGQCSGESSCPPEYQAYGCAGGCVAFMCDDPVLRCDARYIVTVHEGARDVETTVRHELVHWLSECSKHSEQDAGPFDHGDISHLDCRLWGKSGVLPRLGGPVLQDDCGGDP